MFLNKILFGFGFQVQKSLLLVMKMKESSSKNGGTMMYLLHFLQNVSSVLSH